jgi:hypothetical protein
MIISYRDQGQTPVRPPFCRCKSPCFQRRGCYFREIAQVLTHFFFCRKCRTHITMLPSSCVPYKHHAASEVEYCLDQCISGRSAHAVDREDRRGVHRSTMYRWLGQWRVNSVQIASVAVEKFSCVIQGGFRGIYQGIRKKYSVRSLLAALQPDLCRGYPPVGVFRPLILLS